MLLSFLDGVGEGGRFGLGVRCPGRKVLHVRTGSVSECFSCIFGGDHRPGVNHEIGDGALSEPKGRGMGRVVRVELWEKADELSKEPLAS